MPWLPTREMKSQVYTQSAYVRAPGGYDEPIRSPSITPDRQVEATFTDKAWFADTLAQPAKMSQKQHGAIGLALKKYLVWRPDRAARQATRNAYGITSLKASPGLQAIFADLPESRRKGVSEALRLCSRDPDYLKYNANSVRPVAELLARRRPDELHRDTQSAKRLAALWPVKEFDVLPSILVWLENVPAQKYDTLVNEIHAFLQLAKLNASCANGFFRALTAIGPKRQHRALQNVIVMMRGRSWTMGAPPHATLLTALARIPYEERDLFVEQTARVVAPTYVDHALAIPVLLSEVPAAEREALASALAEFYAGINPLQGLQVFEFLTDVKALPHARRTLYLQSLAGCHAAARMPTHRPNEVAVSALWLYYGLIDHRRGLDAAMELHLSTTLRAFMALKDPVNEAPALVRHAKTLAGAGATAYQLEFMVTTLSRVPEEQRARFTSLVPTLCQETSGEDRRRIATLLAKHAPEDWIPLVEACQPLRDANLYPALANEGIRMVIAATAESAAQVCTMFLEGGLAKAAQHQPRSDVEENPDALRDLIA